MNNTDETKELFDDKTLIIGIDSDSEEIIESIEKYDDFETVYLKNQLDRIMTLDIDKFRMIVIVSRSIENKDISSAIDFIHKINSMQVTTVIIIDKMYAKNILSCQDFVQEYCSTILIDTDYQKNIDFNQCNKFYSFNSLAISALSLLLDSPYGFIGLDFDDISSTLFDGGIFYFGFGIGRNEGCAKSAAENCINTIKCDNKDVTKFKSVIYVIYTYDIKLKDINEIGELMLDYFCNANIIFQCIQNNNLNNEIHVSLIVGGYDRADVNIDISD